MATVDRNPGCTDGEQKENMSPLGEDSPLVFNETSAPLNFFELTPCQFGISVQSFTPAASSNRKDKSHLAQLKARRRSSIGVRGSPETNSLIRFMAQKKTKTQPASRTPELVRSSPFLPRVASTLRQKMASFQNLMDVEESEACDLAPRQDGDTGGCIKTRDYLSDGSSHDGEKENHPSPWTGAQSKRRRVALPETCGLQIREAGAPVLHLSSEKEGKEMVTEEPPSSSEAQAVLISPPSQADSELPACSVPGSRQEVVFELKSLRQPPPDGPAAAPPSSHRIAALPSEWEMKPAGKGASAADSKVKTKKKSVCFGGPLSPEIFDKDLPPSTPLQKGGTPARAPTPGGSLRSVLKTPQRSDPETPAAHPNFDSPSEFGASPALKMPRNRRMPSVGEDEDGQTFFPSMEEIQTELTHDTECWLDTQPLNLNITFHEESLSQSVTESEPKAIADSQAVEATSVPEPEEQLEAEVKPQLQRNRRKKRPAPEGETTCEAPLHSSSRKRKQPEESEPVKRSTRSAAKSASGKIKTSVATRQWNKDVDRSLYSSRAYASKNPTLSPITERLSFISHSPSTSDSEMTVDVQTHDPSVRNTMENPSEDSVTPSCFTTGELVNGLHQQKVSVADELNEHCEDQTPAGPDEETPETLTGAEQEGDNTNFTAVTPASKHYTDLELGDTDNGGLEAPTSESGQKHAANLKSPAQRKTKRGRRSAACRSEQPSLAQEQQTSCEVEEKEHRGNVLSGSSGQEEEVGGFAGADLAPWQADFNLEDVFKPVATGGRRSVRRSLRNQSSTENGGSGGGEGLAWLPQTPPDSTKVARRRTRGRRLSAAPPAPSEENAS